MKDNKADELITNVKDIFNALLISEDRGERPVQRMIGEDLYVYAMRLTGYLMRLSTILGDAYTNEGLKELEYKDAYNKEYATLRMLKKSQKDSELQAMEQSYDAKREYVMAHGEVKQLQTVKEAINNMIQVLNSRMADLRREYDTSKNQT